MVRRSQAQAGIGSDGTPSGKRRKVEEADVDASASVVRAALPAQEQHDFEPRHPELWWRDGNVIVAAKRLSFKVHASILERHSSVFRELLDDSQPHDGPVEAFEGCRVLRVEDVGAGLAEMLKVLYDGGSGGFFNWKKKMKFSHLYLVALFAIKYKVQAIIDEAVSRLEHAFPTSFEPSRLQKGSYVDAGRRGYPVVCKSGDAVNAVVLARAIDEDNPPAYIAMALYQCTMLKPSSLYSPDAELATESLSYADFALCLKATEAHIAESRRVRGPVIDALENPLCNSKSCHASMQRLVCAWLRDGRFSDPAVLDSCAPYFELPVAEPGQEAKVCKNCKVALIKEIDTHRRRVFAGLGEKFNIPTWPA